MSFVRVNIVAEGKGDRGTGVSVGLVKNGQHAKLKIIIRSEVFREMGFGPDNKLVLMIGDGGDRGKVRLQKNGSGDITPVEGKLTAHTRGYKLNMQRRPEFVDRPEKSKFCKWRQVDAATVEIDLPPWAKEDPDAPRVVGIDLQRQLNSQAADRRKRLGMS